MIDLTLLLRMVTNIGWRPLSSRQPGLEKLFRVSMSLNTNRGSNSPVRQFLIFALRTFSVEWQYEEYKPLFNTMMYRNGTRDDGTFYAQFDMTPNMSTYLLALVLSDYQIETTTGRSPKTDTLVRVPGPDYIIDDKLGDYSLDASMAIIDGFSEYFDLDYSQFFNEGRAKSDQIGIPDFAGAMENWGLVTYEYYMLYLNDVDFLEYYVSYGAQTIAHELMHQWTGNLVTCTWWDEIWINEAFAEIGQYLGLRYAEPTWNWESEMTTYELFTALRSDATTNSRPIINKQNNDGRVVESPLQIAAQFDNIAYYKGGSITKMVIHAMQEHRWQAGMKEFLRFHQYLNADGDDYFKFMEIAQYENDPIGSDWDLPFQDFQDGWGSFNKTFECWYKQMGYPIVRINEDSGVLT